MCDNDLVMDVDASVESLPADDGKPTLGVLATRLEHLFATVHPRNRGPYTNEEAAEAINKRAGRKVVSTTGIWQLRKGARTEPGYPRLVAIANFFGVKPEYFYDDDIAQRTDEQLEVLAAMRDKDVRDVAMRSAKLSPNSLAAVKAMIDAAYKLEGIPEDPES